MNSRGTRESVGGQGFCFGNPPHPAQPGDDLCRTCGTLIHDVLLGTYQVKQLLGRGRSGLAYLAVPRRQQQPVTIKLFPPDPASMELWEEARREVQRAAALHHSSILPVLSCAPWNPQTRLSASSLEDEIAVALGKRQHLSTIRQYAPLTLFDLLVGGNTGAKFAAPLSIRHIVRLLRQAAEALSAAHAQGVVHGALVPGNLLLNASLDHLWVADFGVARLHPPPPPYLPPELAAISQACWQRANMTPYWGAVTPAGDQFTFALLCFQLFSRAAQVGTLAPERVVPVIQRATHVDPARRFRDIDTFVNTLVAQVALDSSPLGEATPDGTASSAQGYQPATPVRPKQVSGGRDDSPARLLLPSLSAGRASTSLQADKMEQSAGKAFAAHDYAAAEQAYLQATRLDEGRASTWLGLGDTYFALERYTEALGAYGRALTLDPNNPEAWFNRAIVLDVLGRSDQAALDYERAAQLRISSRQRR